jgi:diacylglycerol kinase (ATP)
VDAVFIVNPSAGRGRGAKLSRALPAEIAARGLRARVVRSAAPKDAIRLAREAAAEAPLVVAVGGDGTASEVVQGIAGTGATLALVPIGSGNDLALALGIPKNVRAALDVAVGESSRRIDLGRFDDGWFANSLGLGFEAQVTIESRRVRRLRGFSIYLFALAKALRRLHCADLVVNADGRRIAGRQLLVCIGNGPRVGGGFLLTPQADPADGWFDVCVVSALGRREILTTLPRALNGSHLDHPSVTMLRARSLEIESADGFPFHADGEVIDVRRRKLTIELHAAALEVRAPAPGREEAPQL